MKKIIIEFLKFVMVITATFFVCGLVSIIENGTGYIETLICFVVCPFSYHILKDLGAFEGYES